MEIKTVIVTPRWIRKEICQHSLYYHSMNTFCNLA